MTARLRGRLGGLLLQLVLVALACEVAVRLALRDRSLAEGLPCVPQDQVACGLREVAVDGSRSPEWSDPVRGWLVRPMDTPTLHVDARHVRTTHPIATEPDPGRPRVELLGDSFTFGFGVTDDETWAARLQASRPDLEIVNLGQPGYGQDQMLLHWRALGRTLHPRVVVLGFLPLDIERNGMRWGKPRFELEDGELVLRGSPVPAVGTLVRSVRYAPWTPIVLGAAWNHVFPGGPSEQELHELTGAILDALAREVEEAGAIPVFVHLPTFPAHFDAEGPFTRGAAWFGTWCASHDVRCGDLMPEFRAAWDQGLVMERDRHWSPEAHVLAARGVGRVLVEVGAVPPPSAP